MDIAPETLSIEATYKLLTGCVVPRPIAWVTTLADDGHINAAPFSAFTFVSNRPPMVGVSIGKKVGVLKGGAEVELRMISDGLSMMCRFKGASPAISNISSCAASLPISR
jgi:hypothetical protein